MNHHRETSLPKRLVSFDGALKCLLIAMLLAACGKSSSTPPTQAQKKPTARASEPAARPAQAHDAEFDKLMTAVDKEISASDARLDKRVDDLLRENPSLNAQQLLNVPEVTESLRDFLQQLSKNPELQKKMNSSVAFTAEMKDLREPKENLHFSMDLSGYSQDRTRRLLTSLLSRNPDRVVEFFEKETGEAAAEFAIDPSAPKSLNGITVERNPPSPQ